MMTRRQYVRIALGVVAAVVLMVCVVRGCGRPRLPLIGPDDVVVAFGDSLTEGVGAEGSESYPTVLAEITGLRVVNEGASGELSREGLARLPRVLDRYKPVLIIVCYGGNDFLRGESEERVAEQVGRMIEMAQGRDVAVALLGVPKPGLLLAAAPCYEALAARYKVPYEGDVLAEVMSSRPLKSDRVHPNAKGYRMIAEAVARLLRKAGACG